MSSICIEQYTEKSIVVRGDTVPYTEKLLSIGGKFNKMLKGGEGWIFPLTKKQVVEKTISEVLVVEDNIQKEDKIIKKRITSSSNSSSEVILTKNEYLHLVSRIEKLEKLIVQVYPIETKSKKDTLPLLSNINIDDIQDDNEDDEDEREKIKPLLRKPKKST